LPRIDDEPAPSSALQAAADLAVLQTQVRERCARLKWPDIPWARAWIEVSALDWPRVEAALEVAGLDEWWYHHEISSGARRTLNVPCTRAGEYLLMLVELGLNPTSISS
jgi:hypothetical protein